MSAITEFLDENRARIRTESSRNSYRQKLEHTQRELGPLLELDGPTLRRWLTSKDWAPQTLRSYKIPLVAFYRWATSTGRLQVDPSTHLDDLKPPAKGVRRHHWLTADQVRAVIASCPDDLLGRRDRIVLALGFHTGLRNSEICRLTWTDVDFAADQIRVHGKGEKHAVVGMSDELRAELFRWRSELFELGATGGPVAPGLRSCWGPHRQHCIRVTADALSVRQLRKLVSEAGRRVGLDGLTPHDMRRTLAGLLDNQGAPLQEIRQVLRHSSVATTDRYLANNPAPGIELLQVFKLGASEANRASTSAGPGVT